MMQALPEIARALADGRAIPYLGPEVLALDAQTCHVPATPEALVQRLTAKASVPHKIRNKLTAAAQFIENFKHRKTLVKLMSEAFSADVAPNALHRYLAQLSPPLIVDVWYDDAMAQALAGRDDWGQIQGVSQAEHFGSWVHYHDAHGARAVPAAADAWNTVLYKPLGSVAPENNFIVSDSDFVEVLTEIDIQTPIPPRVQALREDAHFLFLGCRFDNQLGRAYARQIMKRSASTHWALIEGTLTRMETRFLQEQGIMRIAMGLPEFLLRLQSGDFNQQMTA